MFSRICSIYGASLGRPEDGVHYRVDKHIGVAVSQQAALIGDVHSAEDQLSPLDEPVYVISVPYPHHQFSPLSASMASAA